MSYKTPHHAHEYIKAGALELVHSYVLAYQRRQEDRVKELLLARREIDFHARLSHFFGPEASLGAQGVSAVDLRVASPVLDVEIKYLRRKPIQNQPVNPWSDVMEDWAWLLSLKNVGEAFKRSAWLAILPSIEFFDFHSNFQVPKKQMQHGQLPPAMYAPFVGLVRPSCTAAHQLEYVRAEWQRDVLLQKVGTKLRVRRQVVGSPTHPIWCMIYSRVGSHAHGTLKHLPEFSFG